MQIGTVGCEFVRCFVTGEVSVRCVFCVCRVYYDLRVVYINNVLCPNICLCSRILEYFWNSSSRACTLCVCRTVAIVFVFVAT